MSQITSQIPLCTITAPSTALLEEPFIVSGPGYYDIPLIYKRSGEKYSEIIRLHRPSALKLTHESSCYGEQIVGCYDTLVEVLDSVWAKEILLHTREDNREWKEFHHYRIYLDSTGCFEFIASSWELLDEVRI